MVEAYWYPDLPKTLAIPIVNTEQSDALTLMSTDVERIVRGLFGLYEVMVCGSSRWPLQHSCFSAR